MPKNPGKIKSFEELIAEPHHAVEEYIPLCERMPDGQWPCIAICQEFCTYWGTDNCKEKSNG